MKRFRFTIRRMMDAVAVPAPPIALIALLLRPAPALKMPRDVVEALAHVMQGRQTKDLKHPFEEYDAEVRRMPADGGAAGLFEVCFIKRGRGGVEIDRDCYMIIEGGYCMKGVTAGMSSR